MKRLNPATQTWMNARPTRAVMRALTRDGGEARFVGGAVRNALLGEDVGDVDIATPLVPDEVMKRLEAAGLGVVPTGIAHGTVTAIASRKPFEVTTLRRDVSTDGRRATVAFTTDWAEDAARRDFTMNALYTDTEGTIFDYDNGLADLKARRVRFVGDPPTRIREDYLRILRLFRFHAWYGKGAMDAAALTAAIEARAGLKTLSGERVQKELLRLLEARNPAPAIFTMISSGIMSEILPANLQVSRLQALIALDAKNHSAPDGILRLAALLPVEAKVARSLASQLKLSNADKDRLTEALDADPRIGLSMRAREARSVLYRMGKSCFRDQLLLRWASAGRDARDPRWRFLFKHVNAWTKPEFPLNGRDAMAAGLDEGPKLGVVLRGLEQEWLDSDFALDRRALLKRLKETIRKPRA